MPHGKAIVSSTLTRYGIDGGMSVNGTGLINLESGDPYIFLDPMQWLPAGVSIIWHHSATAYIQDS